MNKLVAKSANKVPDFRDTITERITEEHHKEIFYQRHCYRLQNRSPKNIAKNSFTKDTIVDYRMITKNHSSKTPLSITERITEEHRKEIIYQRHYCRLQNGSLKTIVKKSFIKDTVVDYRTDNRHRT